MILEFEGRFDPWNDCTKRFWFLFHCKILIIYQKFPLGSIGRDASLFLRKIFYLLEVENRLWIVDLSPSPQNIIWEYVWNIYFKIKLWLQNISFPADKIGRNWKCRCWSGQAWKVDWYDCLLHQIVVKFLKKLFILHFCHFSVCFSFWVFQRVLFVLSLEIILESSTPTSNLQSSRLFWIF